MKRRQLYLSLHCWRGRRRAPWWPGRPGASPHSLPSRQDSAPTRLIRKTKLWLHLPSRQDSAPTRLIRKPKLWHGNEEARRKVVILLVESYQNCISVPSADGSFRKGRRFFEYVTLGVKITLCVHNSLKEGLHKQPPHKQNTTYYVFHFNSLWLEVSVANSLQDFQAKPAEIFLWTAFEQSLTNFFLQTSLAKLWYFFNVFRE